MILSYFFVVILLFEFNNVNSTPVRSKQVLDIVPVDTGTNTKKEENNKVNIKDNEDGDMVYLKKNLKAEGEVKNLDQAGDSDGKEKQNAGDSDIPKEVEKLDAANDSDDKEKHNAEDDTPKEAEKQDAANDSDEKEKQNAEDDTPKEVKKQDAAGDSDEKEKQNTGDDTPKEVEKQDAANDSDEEEKPNAEDDTPKEVEKQDAENDSDEKDKQNAENNTPKEVEKQDAADDNDGKETQNAGEDAIIEADDKPKKSPKKEFNVQDTSFQKYHAEKVGQMQDTMANNWPLGIIPYNFDTSSFDNILAVRVRDAMDVLESASCVQFKAISGRAPLNYSWIYITNPEKQRECSHKPRRKSSGEIVLILGLDCLRRRDILHSLLHAIGFNDEVTHPNRDQYIRIMWENLQPKYQRLFTVIPEKKKVLVEYDPMSIMHFHDRAFSKNGHATIVPLMPGLQIQPSDKLSQLDKMKLRLAFGHECNRRAVDDLFDTCKNVMHKNSNYNAAEDGIQKEKEEEEQKEEVNQADDNVKTDSEVENTRFGKPGILRNKVTENEVGSAKEENESRDDSEYDLPKFTII